MQTSPPRPRRSVLYVPASNEKALAKLAELTPDTVIFDLEDSVAPEAKAAARERLKAVFANPAPFERVIRLNELGGEWGPGDLKVAAALRPDAILLPKIDSPRGVLDADDRLDEVDAPKRIRVWVMIETPRAMLNLGAIAELGRDPAARLACFVAGTNDLAKETGVSDRRNLHPWLMQMVLAARAGGLDVLDGVSNDFRDPDAFSSECREARGMGFDGKTLIHPAQIAPANAAFSPSQEEIGQARRIRAAFARAENAGKGAIALDGRMVERLHLAQAERLLARAAQGERK
jgi:citrate lyase subunit beta/citryl-CoA lyase